MGGVPKQGSVMTDIDIRHFLDAPMFLTFASLVKKNYSASKTKRDKKKERVPK